MNMARILESAWTEDADRLSFLFMALRKIVSTDTSDVFKYFSPLFYL